MSHTRLRYHIVFATKSRKPLIKPEVEDFLQSVIDEISVDIGGCTLAVGGVDDHIHTISAIPPNLAVSDFIRKLKSRSTTAMKATFAELEDFAWQVGYGCFTLDPHNMSRIFSYVTHQRQRHEKNLLWEEYEKIAYDGRR